jgi:TonB family protein
MHAKRLFLTLNLLLMALSAGALHAAEASQAAAAKPYDCPAPILPIAAVREDMSGDVTLQYQGNAQGRIADAKIIKSSGFKELDKAAIIALSRCKLPVPASGEVPPPGTMEYKFGRQVRVDSASAPVLIPDSCAASERFTTYVASTYDRIEAPGVSIRFGVTEDGAVVTSASYEHDKALAAEAIKFIQTCRFKPATRNGAVVRGSSDGFIQMKAAVGS